MMITLSGTDIIAGHLCVSKTSISTVTHVPPLEQLMVPKAPIEKRLRNSFYFSHHSIGKEARIPNCFSIQYCFNIMKFFL